MEKQLPLPIFSNLDVTSGPYLDRLKRLLSNDLDFHNETSDHAPHAVHSFPAKFPPQLPKAFISTLTESNDIVLDPMSGSGTTALEAMISGRQGIAFDIDPLALLLTKVKTTSLDKKQVLIIGNNLIDNALNKIENGIIDLENELSTRWDESTREFINYWFAHETQIELIALIDEIEKISEISIKNFFQLAFSSIIITKSGGVSLAFDLGHTRPHKAKVAISSNGTLLYGEIPQNMSSQQASYQIKKIKPAIIEFRKRFLQNLKDLLDPNPLFLPPRIEHANIENLPLENDSVDAIITSPPYASNAIDYMRAHKFTLVWFGYPINRLSQDRREYIGGEDTVNLEWELLPRYPNSIVESVRSANKKKGQILHRYYSEMTRALKEMYRVLKPGKAAIVVVGNSVLGGIDTETHLCLSDIGKSVGFLVPHIGIRNIDRNKRMLPVGNTKNTNSQIQQRMHEEYIIGFYKPKN